MNDPINVQPPAFIQAGETTPVLLSIIKAENGQYRRSTQDNVQRARRIGDALVEVKHRCNKIGEWTDALKAAEVSKQDASRFMKVAANWHKLNHPGSVREALQMLSEEVAEQQEPTNQPPPVQPSANPPLCKRCDRNARVHKIAPEAGCKDCKELRKNWKPPEVTEEPANESDSEEEGQEEEAQADPAAGLNPIKPPKKGPKQKHDGNGAAVPTMTEFAQIAGQFLKAIDTLAKSIGHSKQNRNGQADSVVETPEVLGFRRRIEELKSDVAKWLKQGKKTQE